MSQSDLDEAMQRLEQSAKDIGQIQGAPLHFSSHRGDGWQVVLTDPAYTLRTLLLARSVLRMMDGRNDSYIAVAKSDANLAPLQEDVDLNTMSGPTFSASGALLDQIKAGEFDGYRWAHSANASDHALVTLADGLSFDWTPTQAKDIAHVLGTTDHQTYTALAKIIGKSRQSVTKSLDGARSPFIVEALRAIEEQAE